MNNKKYNWHKVSNSEPEIKLGENGIGVIEVNGKNICITKFEGEWFAFTNSCPHAGAPLSEGCIDGKGNVICAFHNYKFNIKNGKIANYEGYYLKTYPTELRADGIFIGIKKEGLLSWL
jgi:nitrite reductase/ring-hydroxylating ferredoxin subunit